MIDGKLGVAIHGAGDVAHAHALSWMKNPHVRIVSISSRNPDTARRLAARVGLDCAVPERFEDVLADDRVDIVNVSGPNHVHAEQGIAAAEAGKHILVEKPMVLSMDENRRAARRRGRAGVKSIVSFVLRWNPLFDNLKALLAAGAIGELFYVEVDYWHGIGPGGIGCEWFRRKDTGGSAMLLAGCHAVDAIRWFVGDEVVEVSAMSNNKKGLYEYDANVVAMMKFRSGTIGKIVGPVRRRDALRLQHRPGRHRGHDARQPHLVAKLLSRPDRAGRRCRRSCPTPATSTITRSTPRSTTSSSAFSQDRESHCNMADAYHTHELCMAIDRSLERGGAVVKLPLE